MIATKRCSNEHGWCRRIREGEPYTPDQCPRCWQMTHLPEFRTNWKVPGPPVPMKKPQATIIQLGGPRRGSVKTIPLVGSCSHEGEVVERCMSCGDKEGKHVRDCSHPLNPTETCTQDHPRGAVWNCVSCPHHTARPAPPIGARPATPIPVVKTPVNPPGLTRAKDRGPFNGGEILHNGRRLLFYRVGLFNSRIHVAELTPAGAVARDVALDLSHPRIDAGYDDPVPAVHDGRLRVWFVGSWDKHRKGQQFYADVSDDLKVEKVYHPKLPGQGDRWEKNWMPFTHDGIQYAVYTIKPHVVIRIDGDKAQEAYRTPYPFPWAGGHLRGGAAPVLYNDEWYEFYHGKVEPRTPLLYSVGVYKFENKPPFAPVAGGPVPLWWGSDAAAKQAGCEFAVVFPRSARVDGDRWRVWMGEYDSRLSELSFSTADVDRFLGGFR